jgi:hypothetical protein
VDLPEGSARRALARAGVDAADLAAAIAAQHADALRSVGISVDDQALSAALPAPTEPTGAYRSTVPAQKLFQAAVASSKAARRPLTGADVLLASTGIEHGVLPRAFARLGPGASTALADAARAETAG